MTLPRRKLPPLNALRAFEVAGRHLNFRTASEELAVTQGAVAQQVRALEDHLGQPLFHRLPRGLALTATGSAYLAEVSQAFDTLGRATARLAARASLTISVTPTIAARLLIPRLAELTATLPGVELRTVTDETLPDFDREDVDIAIGLGNGSFPDTLEARLLIAQPVVALASPRLLAGRPLPLDDAALLTLPLLHHCAQQWPNLWPRFLGQPLPMPGARFSLTTLAIDAAVAHQGVVLVRPVFVQPELQDGRLAQVSPRSMPLSPDYYLVRRRQPQPDPALETLWNWFLSRLAA